MDKTKSLGQCYEKYIEALNSAGMQDLILVKGFGNLNADVVMVGEAPGASEEKQGKPFVGAAGKNLTVFLESIGISREQIYITNVVKFRPTAISPKTGKKINRTPSKSEIQLCAPFLFEELKIINPLTIVTLGNVPLRALLGDEKASIGQYHGKLTNLGGLPIFALYHPASVIYNQSLKEVYEADLQTLKDIIGPLITERRHINE